MNQVVLKFAVGVKQKQNAVVSKIKNFIFDERSAKGQTEEGWMTYQNFAIGLAILVILLGAITLAFNTLGNNFNDGVNGSVDQAGLNQWADETHGFQRK